MSRSTPDQVGARAEKALVLVEAKQRNVGLQNASLFEAHTGKGGAQTYRDI